MKIALSETAYSRGMSEKIETQRASRKGQFHIKEKQDSLPGIAALKNH
jgi:hypothetical protein